METNGEIRIFGARKSYIKQMNDMLDELAKQLFHDGLKYTEPDMHSLALYLADQTIKGKINEDITIHPKIREEEDGFVIVWCDGNEQPFKIEE
jgi:hypothetical protein